MGEAACTGQSDRGTGWLHGMPCDTSVPPEVFQRRGFLVAQLWPHHLTAVGASSGRCPSPWARTPGIHRRDTPPLGRPHLHAVSQDKLIDDEGDEVAAGHLSCDDEVSPVVEDADLDHQQRELGAEGVRGLGSAGPVLGAWPPPATPTGTSSPEPFPTLWQAHASPECRELE